MAKEYFYKLLPYINEVIKSCCSDVNLECKHFFSGAALYVNENICLTLTPVGLALKLPEETKNKLLNKKIAIPLKYFPKAPIKKEYALFPDGLESEQVNIHEYVIKSIEYVKNK